MKAASHADAAKALQRLEARLIFSEVIARCMALGIPAVTIHDCVYSAPKHGAVVQAEMTAAARRLLGIEITAKAA